MKPSSLSTRTTSILSLDIGTSTRSFWRTFELRMRVSRSEMGSIIFSPGGLLHARQQAAVRHLAEAHAAQAEVAVERPRPSANLAAVALPSRELGLLRHFRAPGGGRHVSSSPRRRPRLS